MREAVCCLDTRCSAGNAEGSFVTVAGMQAYFSAMPKKTSVSPLAEPSEDAARAAFAAALAADMEHPRHILSRLSGQPPQVLLLEGGSAAARDALARYWAALLLCPHAALGEPCLHCSTCLRLGILAYTDFLAYDGRISNREDEENPGPVRACSIKNIRELKSRLGDTPHEGLRRIVQLSGLDRSRDEAANALLKVLEEPSPHTCFVLLVAQREQLLPTLVSRSWTLTLPWPDIHHIDADLLPWLDALAGFMEHGRGWLEGTAAKGAVDTALAERVLVGCGKALGAALGKQPDSLLSRQLAAFSPAAQAELAIVLAHAQEELACAVTPARILDSLAVQLHRLRQV